MRNWIRERRITAPPGELEAVARERASRILDALDAGEGEPGAAAVPRRGAELRARLRLEIAAAVLGAFQRRRPPRLTPA